MLGDKSGLYSCNNFLFLCVKDSLGVCMQKVRDLEKLYGSQLVWKIDKYAERMQEAKQGKKVTIFSPPFLTSRHGYKLSVSVCLNGDGKGKDYNIKLIEGIPLFQWHKFYGSRIFMGGGGGGAAHKRLCSRTHITSAERALGALGLF